MIETGTFAGFDEKDYLEERNKLLILQHLRGVPVATAVAIFLTVVAHYLAPPEALALPAGAGAVFVMMLAYVAYGRPFFVRHRSIVTTVSGIYFAAVISHAAAHTGGFNSIVGPFVLLVVVRGATLAPLPPWEFAQEAFLVLGTAFLVIGWHTPGDPGSPVLFLAMGVTTAVLMTGGAVLRERLARKSYALDRRLADTNRKLEENQAALAALNGELEAKANAQVTELMCRAADIEALNAQLRQRVQERSQELAAALKRMAGAPERLPAGSLLCGRARIVSFVGAGAMGEVYAADDVLTGQRVAVKMLRASGATDPDHVRRFLAEATAAATITHPAIVQVQHLDVTDDGRLFQIMEYVDGLPLTTRMHCGTLRPQEVARLGSALAAGLEAAHTAGVVHRDVKPANVMLTPTPPGVRLLDFGLAKLHAPLTDNLTRVGEAVGTPAYMAPEQLTRGQVTTAVDIWALGVILYELLAGRLPYPIRGGAAAALDDDWAPDPLSPSLGVPRRMEDLIRRCLDVRPEERPSAAAVSAILAAVDEVESAERPTVSRGHSAA